MSRKQRTQQDGVPVVNVAKGRSGGRSGLTTKQLDFAAALG